MAEPKCPICRKPSAQKGESCFPFCSERCKVIDLGRWLSDAYRVPAEEESGALPDGEPGGDRTLH